MKRICLGKIVGAHGLKGLVKIHPFGDDPTLLERADAVYSSETGDKTLKITLKNPQKQFFLAEIKGITDKDAADALRNTELFINRDQLPEIEDDDTYYYEDLIGLKAVDEDGNEIGTVITVDNFGAGVLLEIKPSEYEAFYIPFTKKIVKNVSLDDGIIHLGDISTFTQIH